MNRVYKRKKKKKKLYPFRKILILGIITICVYLGYEYQTQGNFNRVIQMLSKINLTKIGFNEQNYSSKNLIEGQITVNDEDGYTATFTTLKKQHQKTYKEYKQNLECSWNEKSYWGGTMRKNGCGITAMAIIASGYGIDITPEDLRKEYYPHLEGDRMPSAFKKLGIKCTDFYYHGSYLNQKYLSDWLATNRPVLICVNSEKENDWTNTSHYMVLLDINKDGLVYVSNPNGLDGKTRASRMV